MSSFISKSKKAFKPKAPQVRRGANSTSAAPSVRGSQEPQRPTPQPNALDLALNDPGQTTDPSSHDRDAASAIFVSPGPETEEQGVGNAAASRPLLTPPTTQATASRHDASPARNINPGDDHDNAQARSHRLGKPFLTPTVRIRGSEILSTPDPTQISTSRSSAANTNTASGSTPKRGANVVLQPGHGAHLNGSDEQGQLLPHSQSGLVPSQPGKVTEHRSQTPKDRGKDNGKPRKKPRPDRGDLMQTHQPRKRKAVGNSRPIYTPQGEGEAVASRPAKRRRSSGVVAATQPIEPTGNRSPRRLTVEEQAEMVIAAALNRPTRKRNPRRHTTEKRRDSQTLTYADAVAQVDDEDSDEDYEEDTEGEQELATEEGEGNDEEDGSSDSSSTVQQRQKREQTPSDAEEQTIDAETQKLGGLPDIRIGRLGPRELKLRERDEQRAKEALEERQAAAREELKLFMHLEGEQREQAMQEKAERDARDKEIAREKEERERVWRIEDEGEWSFKPRGRWGHTRTEEDEKNNRADNVDEPSERDNDDNQQAGGIGREASPENVFHSTSAGFRIVDGMIVANPGARTLDAAPLTGVIEERMETDIDRRVTGASYAHREARGRWDPDRLAAFYEGLRRWGTDFGMVATWVPGMSRNQVKRKYTLEEKANPDLITDALRLENRISTSLEEIEQKRGRALRDPKDWQADVERREREMRERAAVDRKRAEEAFRNRGNPSVQAQAQLQGELSSVVAHASTDADADANADANAGAGDGVEDGADDGHDGADDVDTGLVPHQSIEHSGR